MTYCHKDPDKIVAMASILILGGVIPLAGALLAQFGFGFHPCHFCLLQRYPYLVVIGVGAASLLVVRGGLRWRFCVAVGVYALLITATLGLIHHGIETKFLAYQGGCVSTLAPGASIEELRAAIASSPLVSCSDQTAVFFGISMALWNVIWAVLTLVLIALQYRFDRRRYERAH